MTNADSGLQRSEDESADEHAHPPASESGTVRTNGIETHYVRRGDGPPVVFVHGMAMSSSAWEPQMEALSSDYTTVAYDVRGHGHTGGSDRESYSMDLYAEDLHALLTELEIEKPVLCGLSMGGCIAQAYAVAHPENVAGLVLSDTFTTGPLPLLGRLVFDNLRVFGTLDGVVRYTTLNRFQTWMANRAFPGVAGDGTTIQRLIEDAPEISHAEFDKITDAMARFPESDLDTSRITAPTLVMHGEQVPSVFRDMHLRLAERLTNADVEFTVVPDAGHASNVDNPEFFSTAVRDFLAQCDS